MTPLRSILQESYAIAKEIFKNGNMQCLKICLCFYGVMWHRPHNASYRKMKKKRTQMEHFVHVLPHNFKKHMERTKNQQQKQEQDILLTTIYSIFSILLKMRSDCIGRQCLHTQLILKSIKTINQKLV